MSREEWLALFGLAQADLEENRAGRLSLRQIVLAKSAALREAVFMLGFALTAWLVMGGVFWIFQSSPHAFRWETLDLTGVGLLTVIFAFPVLASLWTVWCVVIYFRARDATRVEMREGPVEKHTLRYKQTIIHSIVVGTEKLDVAERVFTHVREREALRIYFVTATRMVVMLEPLA